LEDLVLTEIQREDGDIYHGYPGGEDILEYLNTFEERDSERRMLLDDNAYRRYMEAKKELKELRDESKKKDKL
jgi:hypothetical protein